jgi:DNA primase large subunit
LNGILLGVLEGVAATAIVSFIGGIVWAVRSFRAMVKVMTKLDKDMAVVKPAVQNGSSIVTKADQINVKLDAARRQLEAVDARLEQHLADSDEDRQQLLRTAEALQSRLYRRGPISVLRQRRTG